MSAAFDNVKKSWLTLVLSFFLTVVTVVITQAMTNNNTDSRELNKKIESKASYDYVDRRIKEHERIEEARYNGIRDMFEITNRRLEEMHKDIRAGNQRREK